jgi:hypothetical protein
MYHMREYFFNQLCCNATFVINIILMIELETILVFSKLQMIYIMYIIKIFNIRLQMGKYEFCA